MPREPQHPLPFHRSPAERDHDGQYENQPDGDVARAQDSGRSMRAARRGGPYLLARSRRERWRLENRDHLRGELVPDRKENDPTRAIPSQLCTPCSDGRWIMHAHVQLGLFRAWIKAMRIFFNLAASSQAVNARGAASISRKNAALHTAAG